MQRLISITALAVTLSTTAASAQTSAWSFRSVVDPITDARRGIASIESREQITRRISGDEALNSTGPLHGNSRYVLVVKCDYGARGVYVSLATPRGMTRGSTTVTQRFDNGVPTTAAWETSSGAVSIFDAADVTNFTVQARRADRVALRIANTNGQGPSDTVTFSGAGAARAIAQVYATCGQPLPALRS